MIQREGLRAQNVNQSQLTENDLKVASVAKSLRESTQGNFVWFNLIIKSSRTVKFFSNLYFY